MFVLPPPPRAYPTQSQFAAVGATTITPMIETNNTISNPTGPEYQFLVGEGTYVLKEDLHLATPPPHPSEAPVINPNPLATTPQPATTGTKLSLACLDVRSSPPFFHGSSTSISLKGAHASIQEHPNEGSRSSNDVAGAGAGSSDGGRGTTSTSDVPPTFVSNAPAFGEGNALLAPAQNAKDSGKRRKPKNNMTKSNSSFISRVIVNEHLTKRLGDRPTDGTFAFANINRAFQWLDLSSPNKTDYLTKILFTKAHCLCHDVNDVTKSISHLDVIMGFSTGEIIWWDPTSQRYTRLNKNGVVNRTPVSEIRWIPGSENLFLAAHMDGTMIVYDKEKEDAAFNPDEESSNGESEAQPTGAYFRRKMQVLKSVYSKNQKSNPVSMWKVTNQRINAFAFSPDSRHLAIVAEDGTLRIIDYLKEKLLDIFHSYYGGFTCVCFSPDGKYVLTGGQDDLVSIWSVAEAAIVARFQGHQSWVSAVAFDPWRCDDRNYRFGSVGEDCRLCLWDFSVGMLHRPKALSVRHRASVSSKFTSPLQKMETTNTSGSRLGDSTTAGEPDDEDRSHPVEPRTKVTTLPAVCTKIVDVHPVSWLAFTEDSIMTSCKAAHVRTWNRPSDLSAQVESTEAT